MLSRSFQTSEFTFKVWNSTSELIHTYTSRLCSTPSSTSLAGSGSINILRHSVVRITSKRYRGPNNVQSTVSSIQNSSGMFYLSNLWAVNALCEIEKKRQTIKFTGHAECFSHLSFFMQIPRGIFMRSLIEIMITKKKQRNKIDE